MPPRILITRSRHQTSDLATRLRALGAEPILIPTIELAPPTTYAALDSLIDTLATPTAFPSPDWLIFTSANAVEALQHRAQHRSRVLIPRPEMRIAAIGPATAQALNAKGFHPDLLPPQAVAESLAATLLPHIISGRTTVLLIRAETARDHLPDTLAAAGAHVTVTPAYRTVIPPSSIPELRSLFSTPAAYPDAITFTSSSTATNLLALLEAAGLALPPEILRASIGPITSRTLRDLGCPPHLEARESNISSLVETLAQQFHLL